MKVWLLVLFLAVASFVSSCATFRPTPYQAAQAGSYGYHDEQIGPNEYRITASGNAATSARTLWNQVLYRAAEITLRAGREYFIMASDAMGRPVQINPAFLMPQFGLGPGAGGTGPIPLIQYEDYPVGVEPSRQLIATATMKVDDRNPASTKNVFNAEEVKNRLKSKVLPSSVTDTEE